ncbi:MAG: replication initiation factor domain-containing protein [Magnetococcales bacterium]|nr:replication initiation factor domain-containing protein [Magnetococcales bacterium]
MNTKTLQQCAQVSQELVVRPDWISVTFHPGEKSLIGLARWICQEVFWFQIGPELHGKEYYQYLVPILDGRKRIGSYLYGGNGDTLSFTLTGEAFERIYADDQAAARMARFQRLIVRYGGRITRIDLCMDDYEGNFGLDFAKTAYEQDLFHGRGRPPSNPEYKNPGRGDTFYVGQGTSNKRLKAYEKGIQMRSLNRKWVRWELTLKPGKKVINPQILLRPGAVMRAAYPVMRDMPIAVEGPNVATHLVYRKMVGDANLTRLCNAVNNSYGRLFKYFRDLGIPDKLVIDAFCRPGALPPARLQEAQGDQALTKTEIMRTLRHMTQSPVRRRNP